METNVNGANKLAERIVSDARADAEQTLSEARMSVDTLKREAEARMQALSADHEAKRQAAVASVIDGSKTRASLDARKAALAKKRAVIDDAFSQAYANMCALDASARGAICRRMLSSEAEGGETVVPAATDRIAIAAILAELPIANLTLSDVDAPIDGGFLLVGRGYEKDCSFKAILSQLRDNEETNVAGILFG